MLVFKGGSPQTGPSQAPCDQKKARKKKRGVAGRERERKERDTLLSSLFKEHNLHGRNTLLCFPFKVTPASRCLFAFSPCSSSPHMVFRSTPPAYSPAAERPAQCTFACCILTSLFEQGGIILLLTPILI